MAADVRAVLDSAGLPFAERMRTAGEGAGYAGGIVSAALDGMRVAERVASALTPSGA